VSSSKGICDLNLAVEPVGGWRARMRSARRGWRNTSDGRDPATRRHVRTVSVATHRLSEDSALLARRHGCFSHRRLGGRGLSIADEQSDYV
jgi:hypothetical protein